MRVKVTLQTFDREGEGKFIQPERLNENSKIAHYRST